MEKYTHDIGRMKKNRLMHFQIGLIIALSAALYIVNYTTELYVKEDVAGEFMPPEDFIIIPPPTKDIRKKTPPPPVIELDPENLIIDDAEFDEEEPEPVVEPTPNAKPNPEVKPTLPGPKPPTPPIKKPIKPKDPPAIIPPAPEKKDLPEITHKIAEVMPRFKIGKKKDATEEEIKKAADAALINFVSKNVKYPAVARENGIQGTVVVRFVVEKDGSVSNIEVLREPGFGLGEEAKRVVERMPKWERVGRQNGRNVKVYFTMPIKFKLSD